MTIIIAEIGVNHNGDIKLAKKLINIAHKANADIVKFQTFKAENLASQYAQKASYQIANTDSKESQKEMLRKLELSYDDHLELINYCNELGIEFLSTAFDLESIDLLSSLKPKRWKIPSGEITNLPYLEKIASFSQPIILSTGMANLGEIETAINVIEKNGTSRENITVLHCTTEYPAPFEEVNLNSIKTISKAFNVKVGYSDHTEGIIIPIAATAMGAVLIEKHITLDKNMEGPDHKASLEPQEIEQMIKAIRITEKAIGDGIKRMSPSEKKNLDIARKSLVASKEINKGDLFTNENLTCKRPGYGISPMEINKIIGTESKRNYLQDELIEW